MSPFPEISCSTMNPPSSSCSNDISICYRLTECWVTLLCQHLEPHSFGEREAYYLRSLYEREMHVTAAIFQPTHLWWVITQQSKHKSIICLPSFQLSDKCNNSGCYFFIEPVEGTKESGLSKRTPLSQAIIGSQDCTLIPCGKLARNFNCSGGTLYVTRITSGVLISTLLIAFKKYLPAGIRQILSLTC